MRGEKKAPVAAQGVSEGGGGGTGSSQTIKLGVGSITREDIIG